MIIKIKKILFILLLVLLPISNSHALKSFFSVESFKSLCNDFDIECKMWIDGALEGIWLESIRSEKFSTPNDISKECFSGRSLDTWHALAKDELNKSRDGDLAIMVIRDMVKKYGC